VQTRRTVLAGGLALLSRPAAVLSPGPDDAHAEIARLTARADRLLRGQGLSRGPVAERLAALFGDGRWLYPDSGAGRDAAVAEMNARLAAIRPRLAAAFGDLPIPDAVVRRMSPQDEARGRGGYREPPAYYVDLKAIRSRPAWTLPSVAFHETVPGHALLAAEGRRSGLDPESWAIYAEQLAADLGAYRGDPRGELGYLHWRLFRMARVVADAGQAVLGWDAARAAVEMRAIQGPDIAFVTVEQDVARMRRSPGAHAAQGLGALAIARSRPARRADWPAFHKALLAGGQ
jgi:uncharacterized protein (DUF885 family)